MKKFKKIVELFLVMILSIFLVSCDKSGGTVRNKVSSEELKVHFIDVGQADSILVQCGNENMLIDAGNNDDEGTLKKYLDNLKITDFKYVVGTHPHEDHIGSLDYIINSFKIGNIYMPNVTSTTKTFENVVTAASRQSEQFTAPKVGDTFNLGDAKCTILAPNGTSYESLNNYSIVIKLEYGDTSFLFTGDAETESEEEMLKKSLDLKADVLKAGHHGSSTSSSDKFLDAVNPKYSVISVGKDNDYGHPHKETIDKFNKRGIEIYRTDESGTIVASSDGKKITFNCNPSTSNSTGKSSSISKDTSSSNSKKDSSLSESKSSAKTSNNKESQIVWVSGNSSKVYHKDKTCSGMKNPTKYTLKDAEAKGLKACSKCAE